MKPPVGGFSVFRDENKNWAIAAVLVVTYAITVAVLLMSRRSPDSTPQAPAPNAIANLPQRRPGLLGRPGNPAPIRQPAAPTPRAQSMAAPAAPIATEIPVNITFRHRPDRNVYEGSVVNQSGEDLTVEVVFFSPGKSRTSKIELNVPAFHAEAFGRDDGLELDSGDEVTIKSGSYAEKHTIVR
jgi:type IV secretory pathway VirB10-like protein